MLERILADTAEESIDQVCDSAPVPRGMYVVSAFGRKWMHLLGLLGSSSSQHRRTLELALQKSDSSFRITSGGLSTHARCACPSFAPKHQRTNVPKTLPKHQSTWRTPWQGPCAATRLSLTYNRGVARQAADPDPAKKYDKAAAIQKLTKALQEVCRLAPPSPFPLNPTP